MKIVPLKMLLVIVLMAICQFFIFSKHDYDDTQKLYFLMVGFIGLIFGMTSRISAFGKWICNHWSSIPKDYTRAFIVILLVSVVVFGFHIANFMFGNHDWLIATARENWCFRNNIGRYGTNLVKQILFDNAYLPVISPLIALCGSTITALLLFWYWKVPANYVVLVVCGLVFTTNPLQLEWMYYVDSMPDFFVMPIAIISAFLILGRLSSNDGFKLDKYFWATVLMLNYAIAVYPASISTVLVVFFGGLFFYSVDNQLDLKHHIVRPLLSIGGACFVFKLALVFLKYKGTLVDDYTNQSIALNELPASIIRGVQVAFEQLVWYQFPFIPNFIAECFLVLFFILVYMVITEQKSAKKKAIELGLLFMIIVSTKIAPIMSGNIAFCEPRLDRYGLLFFYMFVVSALFRIAAKKDFSRIKMITTAICVGIVWVSCVNDFNAQRVWHWGYETEKMTWNRVIDRIESLEDFDINKSYDVVVIGVDKPMRPKFYEMTPATESSLGLLMAPYEGVSPLSAISTFSELKTKRIFVYKEFGGELTEKHKEIIGNLYKSGELTAAKAWPSNKAIWLSDDVLVIVFSQAALDKVVSDCSELFLEK